MSRLSLGKVTVNDLANRAPGDPAAPILTSPRSLRVCLERGVEPDMLVPRLPESFAKPELSAEHVKVKWERHERTRLQRVVALNKARDALPEAPDEEAPRVPGVAGAGLMTSGSPVPSGASPAPSFAPVSPARTSPSLFGHVVTPRHSTLSPYATPKRRPAPLRPTSAPAHAARGDSAVISAFQEEERRLEAARRRTEKQVVMMAAARRTADLRRAATEAKLARARRMDEAREAEKARVERERCERAFAEVQQKREAEQRLAEAKRRESEARFQARQRALREKKEAEERARLEGEAEEARRREKQDAFRARTESIAENKARLLRVKETNMRERERKRVLAKEEEARALREQAEQKRRHFNGRLENARSKLQNVTETKRLSIVRKTAKAEYRKMSAAEAEEAERQRRLDVVAEKQRERDARYDDAKRMERARSARLLRKREEEEAKLARAEEQRRKDFEMQTLEKRLTLEEKREHVEMTARRRQYEAALLLEKIERDTARAKAVNAAKEELAQRRRLNNDELRLERELLLRADAREIRRVRSIKAKHRPVSARPASALSPYGGSPFASPHGSAYTSPGREST